MFQPQFPASQPANANIQEERKKKDAQQAIADICKQMHARFHYTSPHSDYFTSAQREMRGSVAVDGDLFAAAPKTSFCFILRR